MMCFGIFLESWAFTGLGVQGESWTREKTECVFFKREVTNSLPAGQVATEAAIEIWYDRGGANEGVICFEALCDNREIEIGQKLLYYPHFVVCMGNKTSLAFQKSKMECSGQVVGIDCIKGTQTINDENGYEMI